MSFLERSALAQNVELRERINVALVTAAKDVAAEAVNTDYVAYYTARRSLATAVLNQPQGFLDRFAWAVATNVAITDQSSDSDIQYTVNSVWDAVAGVDPTTKPPA